MSGTLAFYGIMLALLMLDWRFAVAYWVYPHIEATTLLVNFYLGCPSDWTQFRLRLTTLGMPGWTRGIPTMII